MRLIVRQEEIFVEIFRVGFYESKNVSVIGEYFLFEQLQQLIPTGTNFHSHFIYSDNGNYHFSIKYFDLEEKVYVDRKTYYNHIATRKGDNPNFTSEIPYERRDKIVGNMLDMFMMSEPLKPWNEIPIGHQFGTTSITSTPSQLINLKNIEDKKINDDDIIIDLDKYKNMNINFGTALFRKGNPAFDLSKLSNDIIVIEKAIERDNLILRNHVIITEN